MSDAKRFIESARPPKSVEIKPVGDMSRRPRVLPEHEPAHARNDTGPDGRLTVAQLMDELVQLRAELDTAQQRVAELESAADEDPLLPLLNRRGFVRELERAIDYARRYESPISVIYIDLDRFKTVNDTFGHAAGDEVLRAVATLLSRNVRRSDIVGRIGGDEFAIVLQRANLSIAEQKAQQLEAAAAAVEIDFNGRKIAPRISAGAAAVLPSDDTESILKRADEAMYLRKSINR